MDLISVGEEEKEEVLFKGNAYQAVMKPGQASITLFPHKSAWAYLKYTCLLDLLFEGAKNLSFLDQ